jgi:hypothetical protein
MQTPLVIIESWISSAETRGMRHHACEFWVIRDILEGVLNVPPWRKTQAVEFLKICKASEERDILMEAMK